MGEREVEIMSRTTWQSEPVHQLLKYRDENADLYWDPGYDLTLWISSSPDTMGESPYIRIGGYENFLEASGLNTLENVPGDDFITATFEIPDRRPGRPRERKEPVERSAIDLPTSLWQALDAARGEDSRRAFIEAAIREKLERIATEQSTEEEAEELRKVQALEVRDDRQHLQSELDDIKARGGKPWWQES